MSDAAAPPPAAIAGRFTGLRTRLLAILLRGYLLLVPTLGIYRFWLVTQKRRFLWSHTRLGDNALEYVGTAAEILFGFLVAIAIFVPIYLFFLYIGTQTETVARIGGVAALLAIFLLFGFAQFRSRRYRLTRTLWRGIRFNQSGSALRYALMRFGWYLLTALTLGLAYPFMSASLFRYRYVNTWYGDRQVTFHGSWRDIAGPFYTIWIMFALAAGLSGFAVATGGGGPWTAVGAGLAAALVALLAFPYITARERTRFTSKIAIGDSPVGLQIRARALVGMYLVYLLMLLVAAAGVGLLFTWAVFGRVVITNDFDFDPAAVLAVFGDSGFLTILAIAAVYLGTIGILSLVAELFLGFTFWRMAVSRLTIANPGSLDTVRAGAGASRAIGEGIADALGSGGY